MQALGRNKASVAQDFHNAGGGDQHQPQFDEPTTDTDQLSPTQPPQSPPGGKSPKAMSRPKIKNSPPATENSSQQPSSPNNNNNKKRRRKSHDKENTLKSTPPSPIKRQLLNEIKNKNAGSSSTDVEKLSKARSIFDKLYKDSFEKSSTNFLIDELLKNHKELTVIPQNNNNTDLANANDLPTAPSVQQRSRKQEKPRKIEKIVEQSSTTSALRSSVACIRDKHMLRLVSNRGKRCRICSEMINSYHSVVSLLLHKKWRHTGKQYKCAMCKKEFRQGYQLKIHRRLTHRHKKISSFSVKRPHAHKEV
jgi:hypothetical protein